MRHVNRVQWAVMLVQLVDWSNLTPENTGSNPVIDNFIEHLFPILISQDMTKMKRKV